MSTSDPHGLGTLCEKNPRAAGLESGGDLSSGAETHSWRCLASAAGCSLRGPNKPGPEAGGPLGWSLTFPATLQIRAKGLAWPTAPQELGRLPVATGLSPRLAPRAELPVWTKEVQPPEAATQKQISEAREEERLGPIRFSSLPGQ